MKLSEINIRDPYILPFEGVYYLYGTRGGNCWEQPSDLTTLGFDVYISSDLENWCEPKEIFRYKEGFWGDQNFWAPEVHLYEGKFYLFATFIGKNRNRGTQVLVSNHPTGPFVPHSEGAITPKDWSCLDGTLYIDKKGTPYMVFCHEWVQIRDGTICAVALSKDLKKAVGEVKQLFSASAPPWATLGSDRFVTDGPCLYQAGDGRLLLFWSSLKGEDYVEAISYTENMELQGDWQHKEQLFFEKDGGHGMLFQAFDGTWYFTLHQPNEREKEHPVLIKVDTKKL